MADCTQCSGRNTPRPEKYRTDLLARLKRIEGQVRGLCRMIEEDVYCDDIIHQISAVQSALDSVERQLLESHVRNCVVQRLQSGELEVIEELLQTIKAVTK
jgi:DNA-binding FrmR family transcriptional regulator